MAEYAIVGCLILVSTYWAYKAGHRKGAAWAAEKTARAIVHHFNERFRNE